MKSPPKQAAPQLLPPSRTTGIFHCIPVLVQEGPALVRRQLIRILRVERILALGRPGAHAVIVTRWKGHGRRHAGLTAGEPATGVLLGGHRVELGLQLVPCRQDGSCAAKNVMADPSWAMVITHEGRHRPEGMLGLFYCWREDDELAEVAGLGRGWTGRRSWTGIRPPMAPRRWSRRAARNRRTRTSPHETLAGDGGRHHDQRAVAVVFAEAARQRDAGAVEGLVQNPAQSPCAGGQGQADQGQAKIR